MADTDVIFQEYFQGYHDNPKNSQEKIANLSILYGCIKKIHEKVSKLGLVTQDVDIQLKILKQAEDFRNKTKTLDQVDADTQEYLKLEEEIQLVCKTVITCVSLLTLDEFENGEDVKNSLIDTYKSVKDNVLIYLTSQEMIKYGLVLLDVYAKTSFILEKNRE